MPRSLIPKDAAQFAKMCQNLRPNQVKAVIALANGSPYAEAAKQANVAKNRIYLWMQEVAFRKAVLASVSEIYWESIDRAVESSSQAMDVVLGIMNNEAARDRDRIEAAKVVLGQAGRWEERILTAQMQELERRLESFEQQPIAEAE